MTTIPLLLTPHSVSCAPSLSSRALPLRPEPPKLRQALSSGKLVRLRELCLVVDVMAPKVGIVYDTIRIMHQCGKGLVLPRSSQTSSTYS